ncbi:MAG: hypothetical protein R8K47_04365, partial [Mariprofundaceae bacterium]
MTSKAKGATTSLMQRLTDRLKDDLSEAKDSDVRAFVAHAMDVQEKRPFPEIVQSMLDAGIPAARVLAALLKCEWTSLQQKLEACGSSGEPSFCRRQVESLTSCVNHYNTLQAAILDTAESVWNRRLGEEHKLRVLAEARAQWLHDGRMPLENFFHEMPVRAKAEVL